MNFGSLTNIFGLIFVVIFLGLMVFFFILSRRYTVLELRKIPAFTRLGRAIGLAVEDGTRLHLTVGSGSITGPESASAFVGLSMLRQVTDITSDSDRPPVASAGDAALSILARDTLQTAHLEIEAETRFDPGSAVLTGVTPFSYAAGTIPLLRDENVSTNVLAGSFASEAALITDASERENSFSLGGTENISGQSVLYATAQEPLIGEELYAGGAYLDAGSMHTASLHAQDAIRIVIIIMIILGALASLVGL
ncbi:MAG: DUF6754 domain-containing protein [Anaerolineales bacterium]|nr:DUF6754 domain-containing protein [Anaerolineales bacterium]